MFAGVHTALVTPLTPKGPIDADAFRALIDKQFDNGVNGIVPMGTTGESPTFPHEEHARVIEVAVKQAGKRGLVIAGTGSNSTKEAVSLTQSAEHAGADAALLVTPYYNKPSQEGLFLHYRAIAESTSLPLVLYSIPGRCSIAIEIDTIERLIAACPNIRAIKEAGGEVQRVTDMRSALPEDFEILCGDDALTIDFMKEGGVGVISVASNLIPAAMVEIVKSMAAGDHAGAEAVAQKYQPLFDCLLSLDTNPVPIKAALALVGECATKLRLPMVEMSDEKTAELKSILESIGVLS